MELPSVGVFFQDSVVLCVFADIISHKMLFDRLNKMLFDRL